MIARVVGLMKGKRRLGLQNVLHGVVMDGFQGVPAVQALGKPNAMDEQLSVNHRPPHSGDRREQRRRRA